MSAATPERGVYGQRAQRALEAAERQVAAIPVGEVRTDVLAAHSANAQVFTSAAIAHALLEIGDVLRAALRESSDG
jgi:hypothetical protein